MSLDIRIPIGLMFALVGAILLVFGLVSFNSDIYKVSMGININLYSGIVSLIFGLLMLWLSWLSATQKKPGAKPWATRLAGVGAFLGCIIGGICFLSFPGHGRLLSGEEESKNVLTIVIFSGIGGFLGRLIGKGIDKRKL